MRCPVWGLPFWSWYTFIMILLCKIMTKSEASHFTYIQWNPSIRNYPNPSSSPSPYSSFPFPTSKPGLIHHMSDIRWMQCGRDNDVRGRGLIAHSRKNRYEWVIIHKTWPVQKVQSKNTLSSTDCTTMLLTMLWSMPIPLFEESLNFIAYVCILGRVQC